MDLITNSPIILTEVCLFYQEKKRKTMITLKDIAKEAGVSIMTVSNVLNSNFHKVSEKNREKIKAIIKRTGYTPSSTARSLVARSSKIIAIMIPEICRDRKSVV